jgi:O-6-methylguanine DNA methyltransferase
MQNSKMKHAITFSAWRSPFGWIGMTANARGMRMITVPRKTRRAALADLQLNGNHCAGENAYIRVTRLELDRYFNRNPRADFSRIVLDFSQGTAFEQQVWQLVRAIPRGETRTYGEIARALGRPHAARAVGRCNAKNPWAIVVPCHRLVGSEAQLRGYGGGRLMKQKLLELEGIDLTALRAKRLTAAFPSAPATRGRRRADANRN